MTEQINWDLILKGENRPVVKVTSKNRDGEEIVRLAIASPVVTDHTPFVSLHFQVADEKISAIPKVEVSELRAGGWHFENGPSTKVEFAGFEDDEAHGNKTWSLE